MSNAMWDQVKGNWKQFKGEVQKQWGKLTDDDLAQIQGEREKLIGRLQERYGEARQEIQRQVDEWISQHQNT